MKEFYFPISREQLKVGLYPTRGYARGGAATSLLNLKPDGEKLTAFLGLPRHGALQQAQVFGAQEMMLAVDEDHLYYWESDIEEWEPLDTYDWSTGALQAITTGGVWQMADFGSCWFLHNGECVIAKYPRRVGQQDRLEQIVVQSDMQVTSGCAWKGRYVYGGFNAENFQFGRWNTFFNEISDLPNLGLEFGFSLGSTHLAWSSVGGGNATWLYDFLYSSSTENILPIMEQVQRGDSGFIKLPCYGPIQVVKPLGDLIAVYTSDKVVLLRSIIDPVPTLTVFKVYPLGIYGRGAVAGGDQFHVMLDTSGRLYKIGVDGTINQLGYQDHMQKVMSSSTTMSFNEIENEIYICDTNRSYVLTSTGLSKISQKVWGCANYLGEAVGICTEAAEQQPSFHYVSSPFDMEFPGLKSISQVHVLGHELESVEVCLFYRYEQDREFEQTNWLKMSKRDMQYSVPMTASEFKVGVRGQLTSQSSSLEGLEIRYRMPDRRFVRGMYDASQARS